MKVLVQFAIIFLIGIGIGSLLLTSFKQGVSSDIRVALNATGILSLGLGAIAGAIWYRQP